jgi:hypothetical protein
VLTGNNIYSDLKTLPRDLQRVSNISNFLGNVSEKISEGLCNYLDKQLNNDFMEAFFEKSDKPKAYENNAWWNNFFVKASEVPYLKENFLTSENVAKMMNFNQLCADYKQGCEPKNTYSVMNFSLPEKKLERIPYNSVVNQI